jgi:3-oxoacyl-[acyl-carrier protein] reductase
MKLPKSILITGANGQASVNLVAYLLSKKCRLMLLAHDRTDRIKKLMAAYPDQCWLDRCELTDFSATTDAITRLIQFCGDYPTGLAHLAAVRSYDAKPLADSGPAIWQEVISSNIMMAYNVLRIVLPGMKKLRKGKIVLLGSNVTRTGLPYGSAYAAGKAALSNLVRTLAYENASYNIQVNMVSPAPLDTNLVEDYTGAYLDFRKKYFESYKKSHPAHKLVSLNEVTKTVVSLLDLEHTSLTGEEIYLTGGVL